MRINLTPREHQIMLMVAKDCMMNKQIASALGVSQKTVEAHRATILRKLEVRSLSELCKMYWAQFIPVI